MSSYPSSYQNNSPSEAEFQKIAQTVASNLQKILQNVSSMQRMVNQFNTVHENPDLKQQLHQLRTYTQQLIKDTDNRINELHNCKDRHLKIQKDRLVDEFTAAITAFQAVQRKNVDIEKNAIREARAHNYKIAKPPQSNRPFDNEFNDNRGPIQMQTESIDLESLEEQERSIRELEENIVGVNEIYKKLGAMVYEQGMVVDSIEQSVEQTSVFVAEGTEELRKATHYRNKVRKKKLILFLILAIVLAIIIGIVCWRTNN